MGEITKCIEWVKLPESVGVFRTAIIRYNCNRFCSIWYDAKVPPAIQRNLRFECSISQDEGESSRVGLSLQYYGESDGGFAEKPKEFQF